LAGCTNVALFTRQNLQTQNLGG